MFTADFSDRVQVSRRRNDRPERCSAHRFKDKTGGLAVCGLDCSLELGRVLLPAVVASVGAIECAAVAIGMPMCGTRAPLADTFRRRLFLETDNAPSVDP